MGDGPMRFDGIETVESRQHWVEDMDVDVSTLLSNPYVIFGFTVASRREWSLRPEPL